MNPFGRASRAFQQSVDNQNPTPVPGSTTVSVPGSTDPFYNPEMGFYEAFKGALPEMTFSQPTDADGVGAHAAAVRNVLAQKAAGQGLEATRLGQANTQQAIGGAATQLASMRGGYDPFKAADYRREISAAPMNVRAETRLAEQAEMQQAAGQSMDFETQWRGAQQEYVDALTGWEDAVNRYNRALNFLSQQYYADDMTTEDAIAKAQADLDSLGIREEIATMQQRFREAEQARARAFQNFQMGLSIIGAGSKLMTGMV